LKVRRRAVRIRSPRVRRGARGSLDRFEVTECAGERIDHVEGHRRRGGASDGDPLYQNGAHGAYQQVSEGEGRLFRGARRSNGGACDLARARLISRPTPGLHIAAINGGRHVAPLLAAILCSRERIVRTQRAHRETRRARMSTIATSTPLATSHGPRGRGLRAHVVLELDYWALAPGRLTMPVPATRSSHHRAEQSVRRPRADITSAAVEGNIAAIMRPGGLRVCAGPFGRQPERLRFVIPHRLSTLARDRYRPNDDESFVGRRPRSQSSKNRRDGHGHLWGRFDPCARARPGHAGRSRLSVSSSPTPVRRPTAVDLKARLAAGGRVGDGRLAHLRARLRPSSTVADNVRSRRDGQVTPAREAGRDYERTGSLLPSVGDDGVAPGARAQVYAIERFPGLNCALRTFSPSFGLSLSRCAAAHTS